MPDIAADVARLESNFPLPHRREELEPSAAQAHREILETYARTGTPPTDVDPDLVSVLAAQDLIVIEGSDIVGAYPFSTRPTPHHMVIAGAHRVDAMCAIDAVAVSPVFEVDVEIDSVCTHTGDPIRVNQGSGFHSTPDDVHLGIRWQAPVGSASTSMCREMVFLRDGQTAREWAAAGGEAAIYTLSEGIEFGRMLFGRLVGKN